MSAHADTFLWRHANTRMGTAVTPQEFAEAATLYRSVIERGEHTAAVYYNYGTALLLADAPAAAIDALLRAERIGGTTPDIQRNLDLAVAKALHAEHETESTESFLWLRKPLFLHYALSLNTRLLVAAIAFNIIFVMVLVGVFTKVAHRRRVAVGLLCFVAFALFATSVAVSWIQNMKPLPEPIYTWEVKQ